MHRPDERRLPGVITERFPDARDQHGQVSVRHERVGPQLLVNVSLGQGGGPLPQQERQKIERLRGEGNREGSAEELPRALVERERAESDVHADLLRPHY